MVTNLLARAPVQRVQEALRAAGSPAEVIASSETARTAADAARALGVEVGAIVKSLVFLLDGEPVLALVAGDRRCVVEALPATLGRAGAAPARADADAVRAATGFTIGGVAPVTAGRGRPRSTRASRALRRSTPRPATRTACSPPPSTSSSF